MVNQNFTIVRGNSLEFIVNFIDANILPDNIYWIIKNKSSDTTPIIQKSLNAGITKIEDEDSYLFYLDASDTGDLELLNYIFQITTLTGSDYETIIEGKLIITPEV